MVATALPRTSSDTHREPIDVRIEAQNYLLRTLDPQDASDRCCGWLADPAKARLINAPARAMSLHDFADYIASHDRISGHILGIFDKATGIHVGIWSVYIDWELKEFLINVLVGERGYEPGARRQTQRKLLDFLFENLDLQTLRCAILARNERMENRFELGNIKPEHISFTPSANEAAFEEVRHYSIARDAWRNFRANRDARDQVVAALEAARAGI
jgi:RimJ/RimL family protein N-acetyltransferase